MMIGIIAEDQSDLDCAKILIQKIAGPVSIKHFLGRGCGKIKRKCNAWAGQLKIRGCAFLIVIHDLDSRRKTELEKEILTALSPSPIAKNLICIPTQELEAWLLSDSNALKKALNLKVLPKNISNPERINSPKETLERIIDSASKGEKYYINTTHNQLISQHISIKAIDSKCPSFRPLHAFVKGNLVQR
jgi:hypothetical protein